MTEDDDRKINDINKKTAQKIVKGVIKEVMQITSLKHFKKVLMELNFQLAQMVDSLNLPADVLETISNTNSLLETSGTAPGLRIGEKSPDFTLPDAFGDDVNLYNLLENGPVVISFYRGEWCPFCNLEIRALQKILPEIEAIGGTLIAISPQEPDHALSLTKGVPLTFQVLSDVDQHVIETYKLRYLVPISVQDIYLNVLNLDLTEHTATRTWELTVPATYVIDQRGIIRGRHISMDFTERMEPDVILKQLKGITKRDTITS